MTYSRNIEIKTWHHIFSDANVKKQLQRVEERLNKDYEKEKALYKGMFNKQKQAEGEDAGEENPNQVWEVLIIWRDEELALQKMANHNMGYLLPRAWNINPSLGFNESPDLLPRLIGTRAPLWLGSLKIKSVTSPLAVVLSDAVQVYTTHGSFVIFQHCWIKEFLKYFFIIQHWTVCLSGYKKICKTDMAFSVFTLQLAKKV